LTHHFALFCHYLAPRFPWESSFATVLRRLSWPILPLRDDDEEEEEVGEPRLFPSWSEEYFDTNLIANLHNVSSLMTGFTFVYAESHHQLYLGFTLSLAMFPLPRFFCCLYLPLSLPISPSSPFGTHVAALAHASAFRCHYLRRLSWSILPSEDEVEEVWLSSLIRRMFNELLARHLLRISAS
jgi:hypothetical protein